jgi:hypothetical protein
MRRNDVIFIDYEYLLELAEAISLKNFRLQEEMCEIEVKNATDASPCCGLLFVWRQASSR